MKGFTEINEYPPYLNMKALDELLHSLYKLQNIMSDEAEMIKEADRLCKSKMFLDHTTYVDEHGLGICDFYLGRSECKVPSKEVADLLYNSALEAHNLVKPLFLKALSDMMEIIETYNKCSKQKKNEQENINRPNQH